MVKGAGHRFTGSKHTFPNQDEKLPLLRIMLDSQGIRAE